MSLSRAARRLCLLAASVLPAVAAAQGLSWSAFGTVGYAVSDRPYALQRTIDDGGTFARDSLLGMQADWRLTPQWSATVQLKASQSLRKDRRWDVRPSWAFVAWRPNDDWLLRAGRFRVPLYLHSESLDVGVAHDMARLPAEIYLIAPAAEFEGGYATRSWSFGADEASADAYAGRQRTTARFFLSDGVPPALPAGPVFADITLRSSGLVLTLRQAEGVWRAGLHHSVTRMTDGTPLKVRFPFVPLAPGLGYWRVYESLPGPPIPTVGSISNLVGTLGFERRFGGHWRLSGEFARNLQRDSEVGSDTRGGYLALLRDWGHATPYVSVGRLRSGDTQLAWYRRLTGTPLPAAVPGADVINASQRVAAQSTYVYDQHSLALGSSYAIDARQKLKLEWMRTRIGTYSTMVDSPPGAPVSQAYIDVWSLNYNFAF